MKIFKSRQLKPGLKVASLKEIDLRKLYDQGKRGIIIDLDNTLTLWQGIHLPDQSRRFIEEALAKSYRLCLLSNASKNRTAAIAGQYNLFFVPLAGKPARKAFREAMRLLDLPADKVIVVGDQIFTDVLGGNRAGCFTVLVPPLGPREFIWTKLMRMLERFVE